MMQKLKKWSLRLLISLAVLYIVLCIYVYAKQESLIFYPKHLSKNYKFNYEEKFEELNFTAPDKAKLNALLFKTDTAKGLVFYLHGNAGALDTWGNMAHNYTGFDRDILILDYRGFGKSEGEISSEQQFYEDIQTVYDSIKKIYKEETITIIGYSIGTGPATKLASENKPKQLILLAPYYNLNDLMQNRFHILPPFLLNYKFPTNDYLKKCKVPVSVFHGTDDGVIYFKSSEKLRTLFKQGDTLIPLIGAQHNGLNENPVYLKHLETLLKN